ncbi:N-formylglutamate amidohydrolase [Tsuneonella sp. SYSU-LHT278]|uniref:N-formylglutamate amidohydrolase n=1 Tax=Tsuneonella sediminis TaxID=3416089 RepID=UPI003F7B20E2
MAAPVLLNHRDPNPVRTIPPMAADSPFVLVGDHAGSAVPQALGDLGLGKADRSRHIAVDIGTRALGDALAARQGVPFVSQVYSRLVIDCNRDPAHPDSIVTRSDGTRVSVNADLPPLEREARRIEIFDPYHAAIGARLDRLPGAALVSLHSFTPVMNSKVRPWDIGILHDGHHDALALRLLATLQGRGDLVVGDNEPYRMDATDYTVPHHAYPRGLRYAEIEVRQDRLSDARGIDAMADVLAAALGEAFGG